MRRSRQNPPSPKYGRSLKNSIPSHASPGGVRRSSVPPRRARKPVGRRTSSADARKLRRILYLGSTSLFLLALVGSGCAGRRPVARRQPGPSRPSNTPAGTAESAKRSTDVPETPASRPAGTFKYDRPMAAPAPAGYTEEGNASWYGEPFNGRRASNGEIYDMYKLTAAHRTLPFDTVVRVTNLSNGKSTTVRITDHR